MAAFQKYFESPFSSSSTTESPSNTPGTHLTNFSPEDLKSTKPLTVSKSVTTPLNEGHHDPFVTTQANTERKLSATASTFQPKSDGAQSAHSSPSLLIVDGTSPVPGSAQYLHQQIAETTSSIRSSSSNEITKVGIFTTDAGKSRCIKITGHYGYSVMPAVQATLEALKKRTSILGGSIRIEPIGTVAYIRLSNVDDATMIYNSMKKDHQEMSVDYISPGAFGQIVSPGSKYSDYEGQVILTAKYPVLPETGRKEFEDGLHKLLTAEGPLCAWKRISMPGAETFELIAEYVDAAMAPRAVSRCAELGSLPRLKATIALYTPDTSPKNRHGIEATPTRSSAEVSSLSDSVNRLSIHTPQGAQMMGGINQTYGISAPCGPLVIGGRIYSPYSPTAMSPLGGISYPGTIDPHAFGSSPFHPYHGSGPFGMSPTGPHYGIDRGYGSRQNQQQEDLFRSPTYNGASPRASRFNTRPSPNRHNHEFARRHLNHSGYHHGRDSQGNQLTGPHNHVDINRIQAGSDVRTTIMLRNIPNKVNQAELKEILDMSSFGRYDFMYLRIDFSNDCNVGYAFVNFADPLDIIPFIRARANQKWHRFNSDKVAEVSYATIQGRDCLIQKFRNSSVMLEPSHYRPKLFFTHNDPRGRAGQEDEFPSSDNASKLKRSCENAEHVGLFAPSAGQHMRDEQRRRRSQYDRGTSLAEREDSAYEERVNPFSSYPSPRYRY